MTSEKGSKSSPEDVDSDVAAGAPSATEAAFERQKWEAERLARASEVALKEREVALKEREVAVKEAEAARSLWQTPIGAAIIAAAIAALANAGAAVINGILPARPGGQERRGGAYTGGDQDK